ncbi:MAG TPA: hypothetical protein VLE69_03980, partial [Candidatus Saccharimonadales bacterium]|nr:hypothetical protein [Candidatus Saccharimonadales bacterium]
DDLESYRLTHPLEMSIYSHFPELSGRKTLVRPDDQERHQRVNALRQVYEVVGDYIMAQLVENPELTHIGVVVGEIPGVRSPLSLPDIRIMGIDELNSDKSTT